MSLLIRFVLLSLASLKALIRAILVRPPRPRAVLRFVFLVFGVLPVLLFLLLAYPLAHSPHLVPAPIQSAKNLLLVTAHPDDECLFFGPSVLSILARNANTTGGLLVFSAGNNYGLGETRKAEVQGSCSALGIDPWRCDVLDLPDVQDNPHVWWPEKKIEGVVRGYVKKWGVDLIVTFDSGGVSGHINHRAVSAAVANYAANTPRAPQTWLLTSTFLPRKYTVLADLPLTTLPFLPRVLRAVFSGAPPAYNATTALLVNNWETYRRTRAAFRYHASQYSWDRVLYMVLSRYVWFNDLRKVESWADVLAKEG
ncbi:MAG: hypothetical protein M1829_001265 [Trizodia sp. TS-e1964]|nr:MAG: hypothetical protein M1829_001265 [Trizodia sp. TS-e1964]